MAFLRRLSPFSEKTLAKNEQKELPKFYVCDIESFEWIHLVTIMLTDGESLYDFSVTKVRFEQLGHERAAKEALERFFEYLCSDGKSKTIYAHFGGKFDFLFLLNLCLFAPETFRVDGIIPRGSGILCFDVYMEMGNGEEVRLTFRDSSAFLPFGLKSLTKNFKVVSLKKEWDHRKTPPYATPELIDYCGYDCKGLHEVITKYFSWPIIKRAGSAATIAGQAMRVLRTMIDVEIFSLTPIVDAFVRGAYFGGRTEIFKPLYGTDFGWEDLGKLGKLKKLGKLGKLGKLKKRGTRKRKVRQKKIFCKYPDGTPRFPSFFSFPRFPRCLLHTPRLRCIDVNSLYPTVMREPPKVGDIPQEYPARFKYMTYEYEPHSLGFYDATVEVPDDMYVPPLGVVWKVDGHNKFIFPTGTFTGRWSTQELEYARSVGVKILRTGEGAIFESGGNFFTKYVNELYYIREHSERESVDNVLAKLLLNSCYGRFGLRVDREGLEVDCGQEGWSETEDKKGFVITSFNGDKMRLGRVPKTLETFNNVAVAAWVTSSARVFMHREYMKRLKSLYYTDTDSMFTTDSHSDDKGLGGMKIEYECKSACFLLPKTYVVQGGIMKELKFLTEEESDGMKIAEELGTTLKDLMKSNEKLEIKDWSRIPAGSELFFHADRKIVMKGFDARKTSRFTAEDFVSAMEGDLRLKVKQPPKFATFKTALGKGKILTMLPESPRKIESLYDKRIVYKRKNGKYDTRPHKVMDGKPIWTLNYLKEAAKEIGLPLDIVIRLFG